MEMQADYGMVHGEFAFWNVYVDPDVEIDTKPIVIKRLNKYKYQVVVQVCIPESHPLFNLDICEFTIDQLRELSDSLFQGKADMPMYNLIAEYLPEFVEGLKSN